MMKQHLSMVVFIVLLVVSVTLAMLTYVSHQFSHPAMQFLSHQHIVVMLVLVFVSIGFGFALARELQGELVQEQRKSEELVSLVEELLNSDERLVISLLIENGGKVFQSEVARRKQMTRVKAHRAVKALEERGVVRTEKHGKQVVVLMKRSLFERLKRQAS